MSASRDTCINNNKNWNPINEKCYYFINADRQRKKRTTFFYPFNNNG